MAFWRESVFLKVLLLASALGTAVYIPSVALSIRGGYWSLVLTDTMAYASILILFFRKDLPYRFRAASFALFIYLIGLAITSTLGPFGDGPVWLFCFPLVTGVLLGYKAALRSLGLNALTVIAVAGTVYFNLTTDHTATVFYQWQKITGNAMARWIIISLNFMLINTGATILVMEVLRRLESSNLRLQSTLASMEETEDKLRKSKKIYMEYFEEDISGAFISSPGGTLIDCNREFRQMLGFAGKSQALYTPVPDLYKTKADWTKFLTLLKKEKRVKGYEIELKKPDGTGVHAAMNAVGGYDENGTLKEIRGFLLDITEQYNLRHQLYQAQKMEAIGTLAGGIAHDFNNILFPITGHTELLLEEIPKDSPMRDSLNEIHTGAIRAKELVRQILAFSRKELPRLQPLEIQLVVKEALKLIRSTIPANIAIRQDIRPDCPPVKADPTQIHQILLNLTTNALHALEEKGGEIGIRLEPVQLGPKDPERLDLVPGPYVRLTVADTGRGMTEEIRDKIFDPFFTTKAKEKGTGMGLSSVHGIVTGMRGVIRVFSRPGRGTRFSIYFPGLESPARQPADAAPRFEMPRGKESILLVDDEEKVMAVEKKALEKLGYRVTAHTSSLKALSAFEQSPASFDLAISDMAMPRMSGDLLARSLLEIRPDLPILLCTGFSRTLSKKDALALGARDFLMKPVILSDLALKVRQILDRQISGQMN